MKFRVNPRERYSKPARGRRVESVQFDPSQLKRVLPNVLLLVILRCKGVRELKLKHQMQHPDWAGEVKIE